MKAKSRIHFISFSGGPLYTYFARMRLFSEISKTDVFSSYEIYQPRDLGGFDREILKAITEMFRVNPRGFGFWLWKPAVINEKLKSIGHGEYLVYTDVGCEVKDFLATEQLITDMESRNIAMVWSTNSSKGHGVRTYGAEEKNWTKKGVIDFLGLNEREQNTPQLGATWLLIRKTEQTVDFVEKWLEICKMDNSKFLIDDSSKLNECKNFVEHRHDQSIFSCLVKLDKTLYSQREEIRSLGEQIEENWIRPTRNFSMFDSKNKSKRIKFANSITAKYKSIENRFMRMRIWRIFLLVIKGNRH
jgi:hypothetical protein